MPYHADAVHFDGAVYLTNDAGLVAPADPSVFSYSFFMKAADQSNSVIWAVDPNGNYWSNATMSGRERIQSSAYSPANDLVRVASTGNIFDDVWHSVVVSVDASLAANNVAKIFVDRVDISGAVVESGTLPFTMNWNGLPFWFGTDGGHVIVGDFANVWIAPGVSLLSGGTIPSSNLDLFVDGDNKPVNPSGWPSGAIKFIGDATAFSNNQGSGGAFAVVGGPFTNAATSPSGPVVPDEDTAAVGGGGGWQLFNYDYQPPAKKRKKKVDDIFDDIEAALKDSER